MPEPCIVSDCPVWQQPAGCGWLSAGQPCGHSQHRAAYAAAMQAAQDNELAATRNLDARAQAASVLTAEQLPLLDGV
jgi:hypothetical protein